MRRKYIRKALLEALADALPDILLTCSALLLALVLTACGGGGGGGGSTIATPASNAPASNILPVTGLATAYSTSVWQDNFAADTSSTPNNSLWATETGNGTEYNIPGWGNNEAEYYLPSNAAVHNGALNIQGKADSSVSGYLCSGATCQFSSAKVTSLRTVDLSSPGYLEVIADVPTGIGSWPAIWLLPGSAPGQAFPPTVGQLSLQPAWPSSGELDLMEYMWRYHAPNTQIVQTTLHLPTGSSAPYSDAYQYIRMGLSSSASGNFHRYQMLWDASSVRYAVDDTVQMTCQKSNLTCTPIDPSSPGAPMSPTVSYWPYGVTTHNYYLIMNLAIGSNGITNGNNALIPANYNQTMRVQSVQYLTP